VTLNGFPTWRSASAPESVIVSWTQETRTMPGLPPTSWSSLYSILAQSIPLLQSPATPVVVIAPLRLVWRTERSSPARLCRSRHIKAAVAPQATTRKANEATVSDRLSVGGMASGHWPRVTTSERSSVLPRPPPRSGPTQSQRAAPPWVFATCEECTTHLRASGACVRFPGRRETSAIARGATRSGEHPGGLPPVFLASLEPSPRPRSPPFTAPAAADPGC